MSAVLRVTCWFLAVLICGLTTRPGVPADSQWPRFRGPEGSGHCRDTEVPITWGPGDVAWRTELEGQGHSSPCIWGERVFLTTARKTDAGQVERIVLGVDRSTGKVLWRRVASVRSPEPVHRLNSFATPTCATDGQRVVAFFGPGGIHCYDLEGKRLWSRDLGTFPGPWGTGASPIIVEDLVIQNCDAEGDSYLVALDKRTGETVWRTPRGSLPRGGWNTPIVIDAGGRRELVLNGEHGVRGYDPATGKEHWFCKSFNGRGTPVPAFGQGMLFVVSGLPGDVYAVRPGGSGDVTHTRMVWHTPRRGGRDLSSPILVGGYLMVVNMSGVGSCYDAKTGRELWRERLEGRYSASPIAAGGLVYIQNEAGFTLVIRPGEKLDIVARNKLAAGEDEIFRSSLAPSEGQIFCRSNRALYCIGKRKAR
jgi:outer membrane protein assembly factor BamB